MERTIISHDTSKATARIKFAHNDVVYEDTFNLKMVLPGSEQILSEMGIEFTKKHQMTIIDKLTAKVERLIESGEITNPPVTETVPYVAPEETNSEASE